MMREGDGGLFRSRDNGSYHNSFKLFLPNPLEKSTNENAEIHITPNPPCETNVQETRRVEAQIADDCTGGIASGFIVKCCRTNLSTINSNILGFIHKFSTITYAFTFAHDVENLFQADISHFFQI